MGKPGYPSNGTSKICSRCMKEKQLDLFSHRNDGKGDGYRPWCKQCNVEYNGAYSKENRHIQRNARLKRQFGISIKEYNEILTRQDGKCLICGNVPENSNGKRKLAVDHDHKTGNNRGLLCSNCNVGLGNFRDNPDLLRKAVCYLEEKSLLRVA